MKNLVIICALFATATFAKHEKNDSAKVESTDNAGCADSPVYKANISLLLKISEQQVGIFADLKDAKPEVYRKAVEDAQNSKKLHGWNRNDTLKFKKALRSKAKECAKTNSEFAISDIIVDNKLATFEEVNTFKTVARDVENVAKAKQTESAEFVKTHQTALCDSKFVLNLDASVLSLEKMNKAYDLDPIGARADSIARIKEKLKILETSRKL